MKKKISIIWIIVFLCCILVLVPVLCSFIYFSTIVSRRLETTAKETASFYIDQYAREAGLALDTLKDGVYYLIRDSNTREIMRSPQAPSQLDRLKTEEGLGKAFLLGSIPDSNTVTGIYLVKDNMQYLSVLRSGSIQGTDRRIQDISRSCGDFNSARELYLSPDYPDYCYFIVDYLDLDTMNPLGKIIIEINSSRLIDTSLISSIYQQAAVILRSTSGEIITPVETDKDFSIPASSSQGYIDVDGEKYYHTSKVLSPNKVQVDLFIPEKEIFQAVYETMKVTVLSTCIVLVLTLAAGLFVLYLLFKPFKQMLKNLDCLAQGNLSVRMAPTPYWETNQMADTFNDMADRLEDLFEEVYTKGLLLRDAEFRLLESQICPHFIFNILELINMRCMAAGQPGICKMVSNLALLLRANIIHKHEQMITLEDELNNVRYYLELQKERFQEKLHYSIDLEDPEMLSYYLPKLTIQPLVENSIVHGLENKRGGGYVKISIWEETNGICVRVMDNGVGFSTQDLDLSISREKDRDSSRNHVALYNINRRIQLLYGEQYGMKIESSEGKGTSILLTMPVSAEAAEGGMKHAEGNDCR